MSENPGVRRPGGLLFFGRFFGVPLYFAPSWLLIAALVTISYGPVVRRGVAGISSSTAYLTAFAFAALFAFCVLAHELGHTAVSLALGNPVTRVVIFFLGGISQIEREPDRPRDEFLTAAAGPAVSGVLTAIAYAFHTQLSSHTVGGALAVLLLWGNLVVVGFNLLPGLPLDGGRLLRAGVWGIANSRLTGTRVGAWAGRGLAIAVVIAGATIGNRHGDVTPTLVASLTGLYLWVGASQSLRAAEVEARIPDVDLGTLLRPGLLVPADLSIAEALTRVWNGAARGLVTVDSADHPTAIVSETQIGLVPPEQRAWTPVTTVARALEPGLILPIGLTGDALLEAVRKTPASEYLVVNPDGSPAGILATIDLATVLQGSTVKGTTVKGTS